LDYLFELPALFAKANGISIADLSDTAQAAQGNRAAKLFRVGRRSPLRFADAYQMPLTMASP
jgi:hypothetical protein